MPTVPPVEFAPDARRSSSASRERLGMSRQFSALGSLQREGGKMLPPVDMIDDEYRADASWNSWFACVPRSL